MKLIPLSLRARLFLDAARWLVLLFPARPAIPLPLIDKKSLFDGVSIEKFQLCVNNNLYWHNMLGRVSVVIFSTLLANFLSPHQSNSIVRYNW